ncbi:MAG: glycoside hydrolase family 95 protein [Saprospiraceae bacterium]
MKKNILSILILPLSLLNLHAQDHVLWYDRPAQVFEEALPIGNGRIGAMVYGGVNRERLSLNDISLWTGEPINPDDHSDAHMHLAEVRKALFNEDYPASDTLVKRLQGKFSESYAPLGNLFIDFIHDGQPTNYKRSLDLSNAFCSVNYTVGNTSFNRSYFASHADQLIIIKLSSKGKDKMKFNFHFNSLLKFQTKTEMHRLGMYGNAPVHAEPNYRVRYEPIQYSEGRGTRFIALADIFDTDGGIHVLNDSTIQVDQASRAEIRISLATSFNGYDHDPFWKGKDEKAIATLNLKSAVKYDYAVLMSRHKNDYRQLYNRVKFQLATPLQSADTYRRLKTFTTDASDLSLISLYFNYGRYLLISSSRTDGIPINLQGLWNESIRPPWSSNYTVNINTEMNYWPIETSNLSELHLPLLKFIKSLSVTGRFTAKNYYDCGGWVCHHNSDIWAMSNPVGAYGSGDPNWANWQMGGVWLSTHLWEHYRYTLDKSFLLKEAYPLMKGAALFCLNYLTEDKNGNLVTAPSTSPENIYITDKNYKGATSYGSTADLAMIRELFDAVIKASSILKKDVLFKDSLKAALTKLYPYQISGDGRLQEWYHDWNDNEITHRHLSHLFGIYPGSSITPDKPELFEAAKNSLLRRTNNGTGWSISWKVAMWARLFDASRSYDALLKLLHYYPANKNEITVSGGGTYPNLLDAHPPFQIDGNFGGVAGIIEMLMQSHEDFINILPALPDQWPTGSISGLKARGNIIVNLIWTNGKLQKASFMGKQNGNQKIKYKDQFYTLNLIAGKWTTLNL